MTNKILLFILAVALFPSFAISQISQGGTPLSFTNDIEAVKTVYELDAPDMEQIAIQDEFEAKNAEMFRIATPMFCDYNLNNSGEWTDVEGGRLWRLSVKAKDALGLVLSFNQFYLPSGVEMFVYNQSQTQILGAYTEVNNRDDKNLSLEILEGDIANIELFIPNTTKEVVYLTLNEVGYVYRGVNFNTKDWGDSQWCEVNINCSEGNNWQIEKRGVTRILITLNSGQYWCTGSLVNNGNQDCTPYVLLADHCANDSKGPATTASLSQWIFYFNYEASGCTTPSVEPSYKTMSGCTFKAKGSYTGGSDFYLVELKVNIPATYDVYFNGWSKSNTAPSSGVCIHHPSGDIKKISTFTSTPTTTTWSGGMSAAHWAVRWASTTNGHGVTEGGSSGSPLFNNQGLIIGTLTGGSSYCSTPTSKDAYGKMSKHWSSNGNTSASRLSDWLDPNSVGLQQLNGLDCDDVALANNPISENEIVVYPNPNNGEFTIELSKITNQDAYIKIFDATGRMIKTDIIEANQNSAVINMDNAEKGVYYIQIQYKNQLINKNCVIF